MPRSHWLDPLARRVLQATGQLPPARSSAASNHSLARPEPALPSNWFLDVNRGSQQQWRELPGCTDDMADLLVRLQRGGVQFAAADDLFRLLDLPTDLAQLWEPHLVFNWYGDAPLQPVESCIDLNNASSEELTSLAWPSQGCEFFGTGVVQIDAALYRLERRIAIPVENKMGFPKLGEIGGKVEQTKQVVSGSELNPPALKSHKKVGHVVGAAGQFSPLLLAAAVHI